MVWLLYVYEFERRGNTHKQITMELHEEIHISHYWPGYVMTPSGGGHPTTQTEAGGGPGVFDDFVDIEDEE